jgi:hypothetical protein
MGDIAASIEMKEAASGRPRSSIAAPYVTRFSGGAVHLPSRASSFGQ